MTIRSVSPIGGALVEAVRKLRARSRSPAVSSKPSPSLPHMSASLQPRHKFYLEACVEDVLPKRPMPRPSSATSSSIAPPLLTQDSTSLTTLTAVPKPRLSLQVTTSVVVTALPPSVAPPVATQESEAATRELLEICGRQEKELDRLRRELKISTSELEKWRQAFTVLPVRRYAALTQIKNNMNFLYCVLKLM